MVFQRDKYIDKSYISVIIYGIILHTIVIKSMCILHVIYIYEIEWNYDK